VSVPRSDGRRTVGRVLGSAGRAGVAVVELGLGLQKEVSVGSLGKLLGQVRLASP